MVWQKKKKKSISSPSISLSGNFRGLMMFLGYPCALIVDDLTVFHNAKQTYCWG